MAGSRERSQSSLASTPRRVSQSTAANMNSAVSSAGGEQGEEDLWCPLLILDVRLLDS